MHDNIEHFTIITLVDITRTGITRNHAGEDRLRDQHRNWETVLQVLGIRAQPTVTEGPITDVVDEFVVKNLFGDMYSGDQRIWAVGFSIEHQSVYAKGANQLALLEEDFNQVPVITGLDETARFILPIFYRHGAIKNIAFKTGTLK
jgi:hypothetical protein